MEQVGGGVVAPGGISRAGIDFRHHEVAHAHRSRRHADLVGARQPGADPHQAFDCGLTRLVEDPARIGDLPPGFEVERRPFQRDVPALTRLQRRSSLPPFIEQGDDRHLRHARRRVAFEPVADLLQRRAGRLEILALSAAERALRARLVALRLHGGLIAVAVDAHVLCGRGVLNEIVGNAERVVKAEGRVAWKLAFGSTERPRDLGLEAGKPVLQNRVEPVLLRQDGLLDHRPVAADLGIGVAHLAVEHGDERMEKRFGEAEVLAVPHRAAHDLAQHVAAPFVRRHHAVGDEKSRRAGVVGDHSHRDIAGVAGGSSVAAPGEPADFLEQRHKQIGVVVRVPILHYRGDALQAHAGVD